MTTLLWIVTIWLLAQLGFVMYNMRIYPKMGARHDDSHANETVSVLIPARNEADNIEACIQSIERQTVQPVEVFVLDDQSTDDTAVKLKALRARYQRLSFWQGEQLPDGWKGKVFACHQLAKHAKGDWLLFIDADVRLDERALEALTPHLHTQQRGIISGFPKQIVKTQLERFLVTMMQFVILCHLPVRQITRSNDPKFAAAHGGFVAVENHTYNRIGGHESIKDAIVDDMALMKRVKQHSEPAQLLKIDRYVWMRMYHNASDVWRGYMKNIFTGLNRNYLLMIVVVFMYTLLYTLPLVTIWVPEWRLLSASALWLAIITKLLVDWWSGVRQWHGLGMAISALLMVILLLQSAWTSIRKRGYVWKGRRYL
ncbi:glycosyltransferase involved in cell wall biosynthesis [Alkalibacillus flavidus]|uniref:Glycosyltransferase involved in cell wall biosynthesis n=1 Tax=Alkalibacillus flavidus TaxID=546021 RepID=A0ABV2KT76_9BACI